jgi:hypothetical protein
MLLGSNLNIYVIYAVRNLAQCQGSRDENSWLGFFGCDSVGMFDQPGTAAQWFVGSTTQQRTYLHAVLAY